MDSQREKKNVEKERKKGLSIKERRISGMSDPGRNTKRPRNKKKMVFVGYKS